MQKQLGGIFLGLVIGLVIGLGVALSVAIYVTNVPVPFVNKGQSRTADQDEAEARKNKNWDPNAPLYGKNPARAVPPVHAPEPEPVVAPLPPAPPEPERPTAARSDALIKAPPAVSADPLGDLLKAKNNGEAFTYFIQIGAFDKPEAAEAKRAELALAGVDAKVSERVQSGKTIYRVRFGPFGSTEESQRAQEKLEQAGVTETALVRIKTN